MNPYRPLYQESLVKIVFELDAKELAIAVTDYIENYYNTELDPENLTFSVGDVRVDFNSLVIRCLENLE